MAWRIYYADGTTFSDKDGSPEQAPGRGVQVVIQTDNSARGWHALEGVDFYWWGDDRHWYGSERTGFDQYLFDKPRGYKVCLAGSLIRDGAVWHSIMQRATQAAAAGDF